MNDEIEVIPGDASIFVEDEEFPNTIKARTATGMVAVTRPEAHGYEMQLVIEQRGLEDEEVVIALMEQIALGRKPISSYFDPRKPIPAPDEARRIAYEGFAANGRKRAKLAKRALSVWPNCGEAYILLAEDEEGEERLAILQEGLEAAKRGLLEEFDPQEVESRLLTATGVLPLQPAELDPFSEDEEEIAFWDDQKTRAYLRLTNQVAHEHAVAGNWPVALELMRHGLRLSPADGLGNRYMLAGYLAHIATHGAEEVALPELGILLEIYEEDLTAHWLNLWAWWFYRSGLTEDFDSAAREAINANRKILPIMMGMVPEKMLKEAADAEFLEPDSLEEAVDFVSKTARFFIEDTEFWKAMSDIMIEEYQSALSRGEIQVEDEE